MCADPPLSVIYRVYLLSLSAPATNNNSKMTAAAVAQYSSVHVELLVVLLCSFCGCDKERRENILGAEDSFVNSCESTVRTCYTTGTTYHIAARTKTTTTASCRVYHNTSITINAISKDGDGNTHAR